MPNVDFSRFYYNPCLQCTPEELTAYRQLSDDVKSRILPIFELSLHMANNGWRLAEQQLLAAVQNAPFIIDLCKVPAPPPYIPNNPDQEDEARIAQLGAYQREYNRRLESLLTSTDGFSNWRSLVSGFPNAIPMVVYSDVQTQSRQIVREASLLARGGNSIAIRIHEDQEAALCEIVPQIINVLDRSSQLLVVFDGAYGRQFVPRKTQFVMRGIEHIRSRLEVSEVAGLRSIYIGSSFARPSKDGLSSQSNLEWRIWRAARQVFPFGYGDYGSMFRIYPASTFRPNTWTAAVNAPDNESWLTFKDENNNNANGWIVGARAIAGDPIFNSLPDCWGKSCIDQASGGDLSGIDRASVWRAVRINLHLTQQADYASDQIENFTPDPDA